MDITVYLPDEIGARAKEAKINLSAMLRSAVTDELAHRQLLAEIADDPEVHELPVEDGNSAYTVRLHGKELAKDGRGASLYLAEDDTVYVHVEQSGGKLYDVTADDLEDWDRMPTEFYLALAQALGVDHPVMDVGQVG